MCSGRCRVKMSGKGGDGSDVWWLWRWWWWVPGVYGSQCLYFYRIHILGRNTGDTWDPLNHHPSLPSPPSPLNLYYSPPFCHFTTKRSTDGANHLLKDEAKNHQEKEDATWPLCGASRPPASPAINPSPNLLLSAITQHNPSSWVRKSRRKNRSWISIGRSSVGKRKSKRKFECESSVKILRKREVLLKLKQEK